MASESFTRISMFLFQQEFVSMSRNLLDDRELRERLVGNGKNYITTCHNPMKERITYQKLVETLHWQYDWDCLRSLRTFKNVRALCSIWSLYFIFQLEMQASPMTVRIMVAIFFWSRINRKILFIYLWEMLTYVSLSMKGTDFTIHILGAYILNLWGLGTRTGDGSGSFSFRGNHALLLCAQTAVFAGCLRSSFVVSWCLLVVKIGDKNAVPVFLQWLLLQFSWVKESADISLLARKSPLKRISA